MVELRQSLQILLEATLPTSIKQMQSKIDYCEDKINELVYQLYDLTPEEIAIIEESNQLFFCKLNKGACPLV